MGACRARRCINDTLLRCREKLVVLAFEVQCRPPSAHQTGKIPSYLKLHSLDQMVPANAPVEDNQMATDGGYCMLSTGCCIIMLAVESCIRAASFAADLSHSSKWSFRHCLLKPLPRFCLFLRNQSSVSRT